MYFETECRIIYHVLWFLLTYLRLDGNCNEHTDDQLLLGVINVFNTLPMFKVVNLLDMSSSKPTNVYHDVQHRNLFIFCTVDCGY